MKASDIQKIQEAGLITEDQRLAIVQHFQLDREGSRFLVILSILGAILISAGIILLVASNWDGIPKSIKVASGLALLIAAHGGGWWCGREGRHPMVSEGLHLTGSGLFLANIALVGQIYHLSSRPPNAILLWLAGIAALPWILRSRAQHILTLIVFAAWVGLEINETDSVLYFDGGARQFLFYAILGILFSALGIVLGTTRFPEFGSPTEKFGLLAMHLATYPLTLDFFYGSRAAAPGAWILCGLLTVLAAVLLGVNAWRGDFVANRQWRWTWTLALAAVLALAWVALFWEQQRFFHGSRVLDPGLHWVATPLLIVFCLLQAQVGILRRSAWFVNTAMVFIGLHLITAYFELFGTMRTTGLMFMVGGVSLIGLAVFLERKRRGMLKRFPSHQG